MKSILTGETLAEIVATTPGKFGGPEKRRATLDFAEQLRIMAEEPLTVTGANFNIFGGERTSMDGGSREE